MADSSTFDITFYDEDNDTRVAHYRQLTHRFISGESKTVTNEITKILENFSNDLIRQQQLSANGLINQFSEKSK
jgi:hypothetical protein